jgi:hypothetical protein
MLLLLLIVSAHNLLVSNLTWQSFLVHKLLIIGLNDKPITWSSRLESWTRRVQPIAAMDRVVVVIVENTHLVA